MLMGGFLMTYSVSVVGSIIGGMDYRSVEFEKRMEILNTI